MEKQERDGYKQGNEPTSSSLTNQLSQGGANRTPLRDVQIQPTENPMGFKRTEKPAKKHDK